MSNVVAYVRQEYDETVIYEPFFDMQRDKDIDYLINNKDKRLRDYKRESRNRSVATLKEYIRCNEWDGFITLTVSGNLDENIDRYSPEEVGLLITNVFNNYRTNYDAEFKFFIIPELHSDGAIHFHGFVKFGNFATVNHKPTERFKFGVCRYFLDKIGINQVRWFKGNKFIFNKSLNYALKYALKSDKTIFKTLYRCSRGLKKYKRMKITNYNVLNRLLACKSVRKYICSFGVLYFVSNDEFNTAYNEKVKAKLIPIEWDSPFDIKPVDPKQLNFAS